MNHLVPGFSMHDNLYGGSLNPLDVEKLDATEH